VVRRVDKGFSLGLEEVVDLLGRAAKMFANKCGGGGDGWLLVRENRLPGYIDQVGNRGSKLFRDCIGGDESQKLVDYL
jgi:hypothetical protein